MPELAVTKLALFHFRNHRSLRLELDGRPVALFGPNGSGKTNVLEAVSLLSPGRGLRRAAPAEMARHSGGSRGWKVTAVLQSRGQAHETATWAVADGPRQVSIDGKAAAQTALSRVVRVVWLVPSMDRLWTEGPDQRRRFLDRITLSLDPGHAVRAQTYERAMRERNRLLKEQVRDLHWYAALESRMAAAGCAMQAARRTTLAKLESAQTSVESAFPVAGLSLVEPDGGAVPESADDFARALAERRPGDLIAGRTRMGPHRIDLEARYAAKGIPARNCSTGEQKALLISLVLASARALLEDFGAPPILLLDEIGAHLDADRRAVLYDEICALRAQAWMTGTGSGLFDTLGNRARRLAVGESGGYPQVSEAGMT